MPKLRFPEFNGDLALVALNEYSQFLQGLTYSPEDVKSNGKLVLRSSNIQNSELVFTDNVYVDEAIVPKKISTKKNDVLMCVRNGSKALVGKTALIDDIHENLAWGAFMTILRPKENNSLLYHFLNSQSFKQQVFADLDTATVKQITLGTLNNVKLSLPVLCEQNKISSFLDLFDCLIRKQKRFLELIKSYKRGVLYAIFNGKTALTQGKEFEYESVENLFDVIPDKQYQIQTTEYKSEGDFDVVDQGKSDIVAYSNNKSRLFIDVPIIVFGDHTTNIKFRTEPFIVGGDGVKLLKCKSNNNSRYLFYAIQRYNVRQEGYKRHYSILRNVELPIMSRAIQNKIACLLEKIDDYILKQVEILEYVTDLKTALLQKLFI